MVLTHSFFLVKFENGVLLKLTIPIGEETMHQLRSYTPEVSHSPRKMMVSRRSFPFGIAYFQGRAGSHNPPFSPPPQPLVTLVILGFN